MKSITFHCEVITPMFLAGADGKTPELRPPSIKGALRFWWRALNGHLSMQEMRKQEAEIFGGTYKDEKGERISVKSKIYIQPLKEKPQISYVKFPDDNKYKVSVRDTNLKINILDYLAYGSYEYKKGVGNIYFKVKFLYQDNINVNENIIKPMILMSRIGGLGAKTRNGFGKFHINKITDENNKEYEIIHISKILNSINQENITGYFSLSKQMKTFQLYDSYKGRSKSYDNALDALADLGKIYKSAREELEEKSKYYKRSYLGSPLQVDKENKGLLERHAKSYFLSIAKSNNGKYKGYIYFIPYKFLAGFDDIINFTKYKEIMNNNHEDFLTEKNEQIAEKWFQQKYNEIHEEFNNILSKKMKELKKL